MKSDYITTNLLHKINYMKEWLNQPATIWKIVIFIFWLWVTWSSLNYRISNLEEFQKSVDIVEIQTTLAEIKSDITWIKVNIDKITPL